MVFLCRSTRRAWLRAPIYRHSAGDGLSAGTAACAFIQATVNPDTCRRFRRNSHIHFKLISPVNQGLLENTTNTNTKTTARKKTCGQQPHVLFLYPAYFQRLPSAKPTGRAPERAAGAVQLIKSAMSNPSLPASWRTK